MQASPPGSVAPVRLRACSPSRSIGVKHYGTIELARARLRAVGVESAIGDGEFALVDPFFSLPAQLRARELQSALTDQEVSGVICSTGGWNAIEVLGHLDWDLLARCDKPVIGFSDNTVLTTALYAKLGWRTYYGPNLATVGEDLDPDYTISHLLRALAGEPFDVVSPARFGEPHDDMPGRQKYVADDQGMRTVRSGRAEGLLFGGNLGTLFLLQGTPYWPRFGGDVVLCIEEDDLAGDLTVVEALRRIYSLLLQPGLAGQVRALVLGRLQRGARADPELLDRGLRDIPVLAGCPIVRDAPFGHTNPMITLPIGSRVLVDAGTGQPLVRIVG